MFSNEAGLGSAAIAAAAATTKSPVKQGFVCMTGLANRVVECAGAGERSFEYLCNDNRVAMKIYRYLYIFMIFIGPYLTVSAVWTTADIFNGLMAIPNMIALFALSGQIAKETGEYFRKKPA